MFLQIFSLLDPRKNRSRKWRQNVLLPLQLADNAFWAMSVPSNFTNSLRQKSHEPQLSGNAHQNNASGTDGDRRATGSSSPYHPAF
jgi:hypothetical protein